MTTGGSRDDSATQRAFLQFVLSSLLVFEKIRFKEDQKLLFLKIKGSFITDFNVVQLLENSVGTTI